MKSISIKKLSHTASSTIHFMPQQIQRADYSDTYVFTVPTVGNHNAAALLRLFWTEPPALVKATMQLRNRLVRPLGLRTDTAETFQKWLETIHTTRLYDSDGTPIDTATISKDNSHLKFTVWLQQRTDNEQSHQIFLTTTVNFHNLLGKGYFILIRPFHGMVVCYEMYHCLKKQLK